MSQTIIKLENVGVRYRKRIGLGRGESHWALRRVDMELKAGESLGVIGRNGAGKSTLLQLLAGILAPDQGRLINHGVRVSLLALQLGFLPHLSGRDNVFLSGMLLGLRRREIARRFDWIVEFSELGDRIDDPVHTYSAGMSARLGFSIAFQSSPDVLLIDEVLGVGDAPFRHKSATALRERILARDHSVVLVSHDAQTIRQLCDRAVWLVEGETRAIGPVDEVLERYDAESH